MTISELDAECAQIAFNNASNIIDRFFIRFGKDVAKFGENVYIYNPTTGLWNQDGDCNNPYNRSLGEMIHETISALSREKAILEQYHLSESKLNEFQRFINKNHNMSYGFFVKKLMDDTRIQRFSAKELDSIPYYLSVKNGVINLKTGVLLNFSRDFHLSYGVDIEFDPMAESRNWNNLLMSVWNNDKEMIHYFQKLIGFMVRDEVDHDSIGAYFLHGNGANGKGTILDTLGEILPSSIFGSLDSSYLDKSKGKSISGTNEEIANIATCRFVRTTETNEGFRLDDANLKKIVSGGVKFIVSRKYKPSFEVELKKQILVDTNFLPYLESLDDGTRRRIQVIPFPNTYKSVDAPEYDPMKHKPSDPALKSKLLKEAVGIFRWIIEGSVLYENEGLAKQPQVMIDAKNAYIDSNNEIAVFISDCCDVDAEAEETADSIYAAYAAWAEARKQVDKSYFVLSSTKFGAKLSQCGYETRRGNDNGAKKTFRKGLKLNKLARNRVMANNVIHGSFGGK